MRTLIWIDFYSLYNINKNKIQKNALKCIFFFCFFVTEFSKNYSYIQYMQHMYIKHKVNHMTKRIKSFYIRSSVTTNHRTSLAWHILFKTSKHKQTNHLQYTPRILSHASISTKPFPTRTHTLKSNSVGCWRWEWSIIFNVKLSVIEVKLIVNRQVGQHNSPWKRYSSSRERQPTFGIWKAIPSRAADGSAAERTRRFRLKNRGIPTAVGARELNVIYVGVRIL